MKKKISFALAALLLATLFCGCKNQTTENDEKRPVTPDLSGIELPDKPIPLEGEVKSIWFDELFAAYYPAQLEGKQEIIFSKAYFYGDAQTKQPVMCLCSKPIVDVALFSVTDGAKGDELYKVERLEPMEVIWIFPELAENANIGISFSDEDGNSYAYTLSKNEAGNEVIISPIEK